MNTYENSYFKIKVAFPADWRVRCGANVKERSESKIRYQRTDDDLPIENGDFRTLMFAVHHNGSDSQIFNSKFSTVIHRHNNYDLFNELKQEGDLISCEAGREEIFNHEAQMIKIVDRSQGSDHLMKVLAWKESSDLWMSIYMVGDSLESFLAAEDILSHVAKI